MSNCASLNHIHTHTHQTLSIERRTLYIWAMCIELNFIILADFFFSSSASNVAYHFVDHLMRCDDTIIRIELNKEKKKEITAECVVSVSGFTIASKIRIDIFSRMILVCVCYSNCYFCFAFYFIFIRSSSFELFTRFIIKIRVIHSQRRIQHYYIPYAYPISDQTKTNVFYSSFMLMFFFSLKKKKIFIFLSFSPQNEMGFCSFESISNAMNQIELIANAHIVCRPSWQLNFRKGQNQVENVMK